METAAFWNTPVTQFGCGIFFMTIDPLGMDTS